MFRRRLHWILAHGLTVAMAGSAAAATPASYTNAALFAADVPGGVVVVDFEGLPDGTNVSGSTQTASGASAGVVLPAPIVDPLDAGGVTLTLRVVANTGENPASSGTRSLGVEDAANFHTFAAGSQVDFSFTQPVAAFGLTLVTPEEPGAALFDADAELKVAGEPTASLALADGVSLGVVGGREYRAYFLGIVGGAAFSAASLELGATAPVSGFFFNVDDLLVPVPEPHPLALWTTGVALLAALSGHRAVRRPRRTS